MRRNLVWASVGLFLVGTLLHTLVVAQGKNPPSGRAGKFGGVLIIGEGQPFDGDDFGPGAPPALPARRFDPRLPETRRLKPVEIEGALIREPTSAPVGRALADEPAAAPGADAQLSIALAALNEIARDFPDTPAAAKASAAVRRIETLRRARLTATDRKEELRLATVNGKYRNLLRIVPAERDLDAYGAFRDFGHYAGTAYLGHTDLPPAYWVYVFPNWYLWGEVAEKDGEK